MTQLTEDTPTTEGDRTPLATGDRSAYDRVFWLAYLANGLVTACNAMMVRYADFVQVLGGEERQLGLIVGCGMAGSIVIRFAQGVGIDRHGAGRIWAVSMLAYTVSLGLHLSLATAYGPSIFLVRLLMQSAVAGVFGASITFVSLRVPPQRMAEIVGTLGTSGFIGIMIGPLISDWICGPGAPVREHLDRLFHVAGGIAVLGTITVGLAVRREVRIPRRRRPPLTSLLRRYTPWMTGLVSVAMGAGFAIPMTFLRPFAAELKIEQVGGYFAVYAVVAFTARIASRQMFERYGNRRWIMTGLSLLSISYFFYLPVSGPVTLVIPGAIAGVAHALLFPAVMAAGTSAFPRRYLGVATSLILAMFDVGAFLGAPLVGAFLREAKYQGWPAYPCMFASVAVILAVIAASYWGRNGPKLGTRPPIA